MLATKEFLTLKKNPNILELIPNYTVPRYTSYPTAPNFTEKINNYKYTLWLKKIKKSEKISLYIHVPFCSSLCYFCACHTTVVNKYNPVKHYVNYLLKEIDIIRKIIGKRLKVSHIHFGGGSPSILKKQEIKLLMNSIKKKFKIEKNSEIAMEIDPTSVSKKNLIANLKNFFFNRVSIGVQDFSPEVQKIINRKQTFKQTKELIDYLKLNGIANINIDLVYGFPKQTKKSFIKTLKKIHSLNPERISIFGYAHVPWMKKSQRLIKEEPLNNEKRLQLYQIASDFFLNNNYISIGIDHYAKKNSSIVKKLKKRKLNRNFQGYTEDEAKNLIGIGASSISSINDGYVQNKIYVPDYIKSLKKNKLPILKGYEFNNDDKMYGTVIKELMCYLNVDFNKIIKKYNKEKELIRSIVKMKPFIDADLVDINNNILTIKNEARPLARIISSCFDQYFLKNENKYSAGI